MLKGFKSVVVDTTLETLPTHHSSLGSVDASPQARPVRKGAPDAPRDGASEGDTCQRSAGGLRKTGNDVQVTQLPSPSPLFLVLDLFPFRAVPFSFLKIGSLSLQELPSIGECTGC